MNTARNPSPRTWSIVLPISVRSSQITTAKGPFPKSVRSARNAARLSYCIFVFCPYVLRVALSEPICNRRLTGPRTLNRCRACYTCPGSTLPEAVFQQPRGRAMTGTKKLYVKTYGCQMNVYDSERMAEALGAEGYEQVDTPEGADMILLNTCHIREKAAEKVYSELGRLKPLKEANPDLRIGVAGCVAQAEGAEIPRRQPLVDLVVGPQAYHRLPDLAARARSGERALDTDFPEEDKFARLGARPLARRAPAAFLTVQEGCDKFCAFCVVPYTRGAEMSRPVAQVMDEARDLVERGVREIT